MTDQPPYRPLVGVEIDQGLIAERELREACQRLDAEGFPHHVIVASIAALAGGMIGERYGIALASAWFLGMAQAAAQIAASEIEPDTRH